MKVPDFFIQSFVRSVEKEALARANALLKSGIVARVGEVLKNRATLITEPQDTSSSEWILWYLLDLRYQIITDLLDEVISTGKIDKSKILTKATESLRQTIQKTEAAQIPTKIFDISDPITQAILRFLVEDAKTTLDILELPEMQTGDLRSLQNLRSLVEKTRNRIIMAMSNVVPSNSTSELLKQTGQLILALQRASHLL